MSTRSRDAAAARLGDAATAEGADWRTLVAEWPLPLPRFTLDLFGRVATTEEALRELDGTSSALHG